MTRFFLITAPLVPARSTSVPHTTLVCCTSGICTMHVPHFITFISVTGNVWVDHYHVLDCESAPEACFTGTGVWNNLLAILCSYTLYPFPT